MSLDVSLATPKRMRCTVSGLLLMEVPENPWVIVLGVILGLHGEKEKEHRQSPLGLSLLDTLGHRIPALKCISGSLTTPNPQP